MPEVYESCAGVGKPATVLLLALEAACGGRSGVSSATTTSSASGASAAFVEPSGALDPRVTPTNVQASVCRRGWSASVRPALTVTEPIKRRLVATFAPGHRLSEFELDHAIPLELGGAPDDLANLWLQPWPEARRKDLAENRLHAAVCAGRLSLVDARRLVRDPGEWHR